MKLTIVGVGLARDDKRQHRRGDVDVERERFRGQTPHVDRSDVVAPNCTRDEMFSIVEVAGERWHCQELTSREDAGKLLGIAENRKQQQRPVSLASRPIKVRSNVVWGNDNDRAGRLSQTLDHDFSQKSAHKNRRG